MSSWSRQNAYQDKLKERALVDLHKLAVERLDVVLVLGSFLAFFGLGIRVKLAVLDDLGKDAAGHVWKGHYCLWIAQVCASKEGSQPPSCKPAKGDSRSIATFKSLGKPLECLSTRATDIWAQRTFNHILDGLALKGNIFLDLEGLIVRAVKLHLKTNPLMSKPRHAATVKHAQLLVGCSTCGMLCHDAAKQQSNQTAALARMLQPSCTQKPKMVPLQLISA